MIHLTRQSLLRHIFWSLRLAFSGDPHGVLPGHLHEEAPIASDLPLVRPLDPVKRDGTLLHTANTQLALHFSEAGRRGVGWVS